MSTKKKNKKGKKEYTTTIKTNKNVEETPKEFYLLQISDLENRLERYQKKCDELHVLNKEINGLFEQITNNKQEIVLYLKKSLEKKGDEIIDLNDRVTGLELDKDLEKEEYEGQLQHLRSEFQETKDSLTSENMTLGGKLASLEEFKIQKEELMQNYQNLEILLKKNETMNKDTIYSLERKQVIDKDRLKKEMISRVNTVAAEFRKASNKQMAETTKRVIRENVAGNAQLSKLSEKAIELIDANDVLIRESKQLIRENGILEENEKELTIRNMSSLKIINMLTVKCKQQQKVISDIEKNVSQTKNTEISNNFLKQDCANIKIKLDDVIKNNKMLRKQQNELKRVNNLQKNENNDLINILKVTVNQLKFVFSSSNSHNDVESDYKDDPEADSIEKHNALLVTILYILKKANDHNVGINIEDLSNKLLHSEQISTLKQTQPDTKILVKKDKICHYKLGDLGLVPDRLDQRTISSRLSQLSDTVKFKLHVAKSKSIGIQTEHLKNHEMYNNIAKNNTSGTSKSKQYTLVQFKNFLQNL